MSEWKMSLSLLGLAFGRFEACLHRWYERLALLIGAIHSAAKSISILACLLHFILCLFKAFPSHTARQFQQVLVDFDMLFQNLIYLPWLHLLMDGNRLTILLFFKSSHITYFLLHFSYLYVSRQLFSDFLLETSEVTHLDPLLCLQILKACNLLLCFCDAVLNLFKELHLLVAFYLGHFFVIEENFILLVLSCRHWRSCLEQMVNNMLLLKELSCHSHFLYCIFCRLLNDFFSHISNIKWKILAQGLFWHD